MRYSMDHEGRRFFVNLEEHADGPKFIVDGTEFQPKVEKLGKGHYKVTLDGETHEFTLKAGTVHNETGPMDLRLRRAKPELVRAGGAGRRNEGTIKPPMPGKIVEIHCKEGDEVEEGQTLVVLEAMKMQNDLKAPIAGTVKKVFVSEGQNVEATTVLVEVEPVAEA